MDLNASCRQHYKTIECLRSGRFVGTDEGRYRQIDVVCLLVRSSKQLRTFSIQPSVHVVN